MSAESAAGGAGVVLQRGDSIDRFVVVGLVGRGGMGEVYAAYDPDLDRKVAIKLLRARGDATDGRTRLLREAQAIARLQHPNVVVVYDVGTFGDSVFIAMEFVEGRTLTGWLNAAPRSQRDILQVFLAAGRGLMAAHAAGLVHRDFKPDNVMVLNDGQVRVMDFGLARQIDDAPGATPAPSPSSAALAAKVSASLVDADATMNLGTGAAAQVPTDAGSGGFLAAKLTLTGAMLGTPAYMAPEQFAVQPTDARTDQFSFCVSLYEFLYGQRPFEGSTFLALMANVASGEVRPAPAKARVPGWLRKVVLRGLETDPARRHASMKALLLALETDPTVRRRRLGLGAAALLFVAVGAIGVKRNLSRPPALCRGADARWAGTWEAGGAPSARKDALRLAFAASGKSYAEQAFTSVSRVMDDYVARWLTMYGDACEATHVRGEQSTEVLDLRMSCLQERFASARALVDVLAKPSGDVVQNAVSAAVALPRIDRCGEVALLKEVVRPPEDGSTRQRVEALRVQKARLGALRDAGNCAEAARLFDTLIPQVKAVGYAPLVAETLDAGISGTSNCLPPPVAIDRLKQAYEAAIAARHDELAARAAVSIGNLSTMPGVGDFKGAEAWLIVSRSIIARLGGNLLLKAWERSTEAGLHIHDKDWNAALAAYQQARIEKVKALGNDNPDIGVSDINVGFVLQLAGHYDEAVDSFEAAHRLLSRVLGPDHPLVALALYNKADALNLLRRHAEARAALALCFDAWKKAGAEAWFVAYGQTALGVALLGEGKPDEAIAPLEAALLARMGKETDDEHRGETRFALAQALWSRPTERTRALGLGRTALADYAEVADGAAKRAAITKWLASPQAP